MNYFLFFIISLFCLHENSLGQEKASSLNQSESTLCFDIEGKYILFHPYIISLDSSASFYVTFNNNRLIPIEDNKFLLIAPKNGLLSIYKLELNDTLLITEKNLSFAMPEFRIFIRNKQSGSSIKVKELINALVHVEIENTNVTYSTMPIYSVDLKYIKDKKIREVKLHKEVEENKSDLNKPGFFIIDKTIFSELSEESSNILIVSVIINIDDRLIKLPPAVYYIDH